MPGQPISASCFTCQTRERSEWCALDNGDLALLDKATTARSYAVGEILFMAGEECKGVHCLESGSVALRKSDAEGNSVLVHLAEPGEALGYRAFLADEPYSATAEVVEPAKICFVRGAQVRTLLEHNPALGMRFLSRAAKEVREAQDNYLRAATGSVRARLIHLLFTLRERYAEEQADGSLVITLPLSRQDLAAMVGTRPETISRTIKKMESEGLAEFAGRKVRINDPQSLLDDIGLTNVP